MWYANAIEGWKDRCRTSICWVDELWANGVPQLGKDFSTVEKVSEPRNQAPTGKCRHDRNQTVGKGQNEQGSGEVKHRYGQP